MWTSPHEFLSQPIYYCGKCCYLSSFVTGSQLNSLGQLLWLDTEDIPYCSRPNPQARIGCMVVCKYNIFYWVRLGYAVQSNSPLAQVQRTYIQNFNWPCIHMTIRLHKAFWAWEEVRHERVTMRLVTFRDGRSSLEELSCLCSHTPCNSVYVYDKQCINARRVSLPGEDRQIGQTWVYEILASIKTTQ
jgi:hypothetical protein